MSIKIDERHEAIARGPFCWGRGYTVEAAVKAMKGSWSRSYGGPKPRTNDPEEADGRFRVDIVPRSKSEVGLAKRPREIPTDVIGIWVDGYDGSLVMEPDLVDHDPTTCDVCTAFRNRGR